MVRAIPRRLGRAVWPLMVMTLVALAVYVSGGRLLLNALPRVQQDIEQLLSQRVSGDIRIGEISGSMDGFSPRLHLIDFSILDGGNGRLDSATCGQPAVKPLAEFTQWCTAL